MRTVLFIAFIAALTACTTGSPLSQLGVQVEVNVDSDRTVALTIETWNDLATLRDAMTAGEITATIDAQPLLIDAFKTGTYGNGDHYIAAFMTAPEATRESPMPPPATSTIAISDGETTWTAQVDQMFANDLAPTAPITAGTNVFEWPSAASPNPYSTIEWACIEVTGAASACQGESVHDPSVAISQQYVTATIAGTTGDRVQVTGQRDVDPDSTGNGPTFFTRIMARYQGTFE
jgi:hypothetical protein